MVTQTILKRLPKSALPASGIDTSGYQIDAVKKRDGILKVRALSKQLGLDTNAPKVVITGRNRKENVRGTDSATQSTINRYTRCWGGLSNYCIDIGDYESAIILDRDECPGNPPPINKDTIISYVQLRTEREGTPLKHWKTNEPILKDGEPLLALGDWGASTVNVFRSAVHKLNSKYPTTKSTEYVSMCPKCHKKKPAVVVPGTSEHGYGCDDHPNQPQLKTKGDVTKDADFKAKVNEAVKLLSEDARNSMYFLPCELREMRNWLLSQNTVEHTMLWVVMIVGIKLFLRIEEVLELKYEQILTEFCIVDKDEMEVSALCADICGKTDKEKHYKMAIWDDEECPEFSALRALLLWVSITGIEGGYLFPTKELLQKRIHMGVFDRTGWKPDAFYKESNYRSDVKWLVVEVLKRDINEREIIGKSKTSTVITAKDIPLKLQLLFYFYVN
jgi:hypothetical protein